MVDLHVENQLRALGLMGNYQRYHSLINTVHLIPQDPTCLDMATKRLYPEVARWLGTNPGAVDSAMRTAISLCCTRCGAQVAAMCRGNPHPTVTEFLRGLMEQLIKPDRHTTETARETHDFSQS